MPIKHHPDIASLMTCAAGSQPEVLSAVIASHLATCAHCRRELRRLSEIGVVLFEDLLAEPLVQHVPNLAAESSQSTFIETNSLAKHTDLVRPLSCLTDTELNELNWTDCADGVSYSCVPLSDTAQGDLRLLRLAPGASVWLDGDPGEAHLAVLRESCRLGTSHYGFGDFADRAAFDGKRITADAARGCTVLIANEKVLRLSHRQAQADYG